MSKPTTDKMLRAALRAKLYARHGDDDDAFVVEELPVARGAVRVDLAVINGRIEGIEIKSHRDNLERFERQAEFYSQALEKVTLVTAEKHLGDAMRIVPAWWSVFVADAGVRGGVTLKRHQQGRLNPHISPVGLVQLLERDELLGILCRLGDDRGLRSADWHRLAAKVIAHVKPADLAAHCRRQIKARIRVKASYSDTAFGNLAFGGGVAASLAVAL